LYLGEKPNGLKSFSVKIGRTRKDGEVKDDHSRASIKVRDITAEYEFLHRVTHSFREKTRLKLE
jgi:hypothetical protein